MLYFDDVKVPWERVFVNRDIAMCQKQFHATPAHVYQNYQAQVRLMVKMRFLVGVARRIAETNGVDRLSAGEGDFWGTLAAQNAMVDALVHAMEIKGRRHGAYFVPDRAHALFRPGADAATLRAGHGRAEGAGGRRHDHAAVVGPGFRQSRSSPP